MSYQKNKYLNMTNNNEKSNNDFNIDISKINSNNPSEAKATEEAIRDVVSKIKSNNGSYNHTNKTENNTNSNLNFDFSSLKDLMMNIDNDDEDK